MPVLIWDPDLSPLTGPELCLQLDELGFLYDYSKNLPSSISQYQSIFVGLGITPYKYILSDSESEILCHYLDNGGNLYLEGGDFWNYDPKTSLHNYFHIEGTDDGLGDLHKISGTAGTFATGFNFNYCFVTGEICRKHCRDPTGTEG